MRYQCRPAGKPKFYDQQVSRHVQRAQGQSDGLLEGSIWLPARHHAGDDVLREREQAQGRRPRTGRRREGRKRRAGVQAARTGYDVRRVPVVAWEEGGESLDSFAAITDEPPAEVAAAGHDRCIIPIKEENIDAWLNPDPKNLERCRRFWRIGRDRTTNIGWRLMQIDRIYSSNPFEKIRSPVIFKSTAMLPLAEFPKIKSGLSS